MSSSVSLIALEDTPQCAADLLDAAQNLGFVYITVEGSGIPADKIDGMFELVCFLSRASVASPLMAFI
jgi:hypothetical protein